MKICFSTLGCPEWSWEDIVATAKDFGYDGVEVRGIENVLSVPQAKPFSPQEIQKTKKHLTDIGISIPILTSDCDLHVANDPTTIMNEISDYIALAVKIGTPYVRVLGDRHPQ
ncbi:MAG: sugar phosphate isomerase/epimerase, partial [Hyphomonadaceae bacterium]|nr:sugar phosphate isomerase/epimerase [Clostridia bacterium]